MEKIPKNPISFLCEICDYKTCSSKDYKKHLQTSKHLNRTNLNNLEQNSPENPTNFNCKHCNKCYKARNSLWYHEQKCISTEKINKKIFNKDEITDKELIMIIVKQNAELIKDNTELKTMMMKVLENGTNNNSNNTTHTNSHNKAFNLNFFLNETCKDAMNIMDFVDSIQLQLSDLEKVGEIGYVEGISNIIVKNLKELDIEKRPVHCTDKKRETMYIKDEDKWEKDEENNKIRKAIKRVASKNQKLIPKFKEAHPDCGTYHSRYSNQYNKLIVESCGGSGDNDLEKEEKILKNISKNVIIEK